MKYVEFTYIDRVNKTSVVDQPAYNGPINPEVDGLTFQFSLESQYPTNVPKFYGTCPDNANLSSPGILKEVTQAEFENIKSEELAVRKENKVNQADQAWESKINSGIKYSNVNFSTDDTSRQLITNVAQVALASKVNNTSFGPIQWDGKDDSGNETSLNLTADQLIELQGLIVQDGEVQYGKLRTMVASIRAATDFSSLDAVNISFDD